LTHDTWTQELIKGRALAIKTTWNNQEESVLINIYTPNQKPEHQQFWETIDTRRQEFSLQKPDFVLGDFNVTEEAMDRAPPKREQETIANALHKFCLNLDIQDHWRHVNPKEREYTY